MPQGIFVMVQDNNLGNIIVTRYGEKFKVKVQVLECGDDYEDDAICGTFADAMKRVAELILLNVETGCYE